MSSRDYKSFLKYLCNDMHCITMDLLQSDLQGMSRELLCKKAVPFLWEFVV
jgi:hypothetical protein